MSDEPDDDNESVCADGYPEHRTRDTYNGPDGVAWECTRCGAEGWEPAEEEGGVVEIKTEKLIDSVNRHIALRVEGAEPMQNRYQEHRKTKRSFLPDRINIRLHNGELASVDVSGGVVLKSGVASEKLRDNESWYNMRHFSEEAPEWLREAVAEAIE
ncbi:hypothetical protein [Plantactinospora sp. WMMB782]|uniref:hypothetical protein n=1 Tax=Plantactinospora sp. WMMB782 TaxID=3404121 RepID=UPI003B964ED4